MYVNPGVIAAIRNAPAPVVAVEALPELTVPVARFPRLAVPGLHAPAPAAPLQLPPAQHAQRSVPRRVARTAAPAQARRSTKVPVVTTSYSVVPAAPAKSH
ncbi:MAG: hypothetical protein HOQ28_03740, partial [Thermoleophilia bacterium]|nr:hypothetical protein [Thermoleophilia bacterium]